METTNNISFKLYRNFLNYFEIFYPQIYYKIYNLVHSKINWFESKLETSLKLHVNPKILKSIDSLRYRDNYTLVDDVIVKLLYEGSIKYINQLNNLEISNNEILNELNKQQNKIINLQLPDQSNESTTTTGSNTTSMELLLIWKTLHALTTIDDPFESLDHDELNPIVMFFDEFVLTLLNDYCYLGLSILWYKKKLISSEEVSKFIVDYNIQEKTLYNILSQDEYNQLISTTNIVGICNLPNDINRIHDPTGIILGLFNLCESQLSYYLFGTREGKLLTSDISCKSIRILLSFLITIIIKSGRTSLLLRLLCILSIIENIIAEKDDDDLSDILIDSDIWSKLFKSIDEYLQSNHTTSCESNHQVYHLEQYVESIEELSKQYENKGGIAFSFGKSDYGKLGHGDSTINRRIPTIIETLRHNNIIKVASMSTIAFAIDEDGVAYVWGGSTGVNNHKTNAYPQLFDGLPSLKSKVIDLSCGLGHTLFLIESGSVYSWGNGGNGRLGLGDTSDRSIATLISSMSDEIIVSIQCGASHSLALTGSGSVYTWGKNTQGQCGVSHTDDVLKPKMIRTLPFNYHVITQLAAGWEHSLALTEDGKVFSWGSGYKDGRRSVVPPVLGLGYNEIRHTPNEITSLLGIPVAKIASGWDHCLALDRLGKVLSWGSGQNGKLGQNSEENYTIPCFIRSLDSHKIVNISAGCEHSAAITDKGELFMWGHGDGGRLGLGDNNQCSVPTTVSLFKKMGLSVYNVYCGDKFTIAITKPVRSSGPIISSSNITKTTAYYNSDDSITTSDTYLDIQNIFICLLKYAIKSNQIYNLHVNNENRHLFLPYNIFDCPLAIECQSSTYACFDYLLATYTSNYSNLLDNYQQSNFTIDATYDILMSILTLFEYNIDALVHYYESNPDIDTTSNIPVNIPISATKPNTGTTISNMTTTYTNTHIASVESNSDDEDEKNDNKNAKYIPSLLGNTMSSSNSSSVENDEDTNFLSTRTSSRSTTLTISQRRTYENDTDSINFDPIDNSIVNTSEESMKNKDIDPIIQQSDFQSDNAIGISNTMDRTSPAPSYQSLDHSVASDEYIANDINYDYTYHMNSIDRYIDQNLDDNEIELQKAILTSIYTDSNLLNDSSFQLFKFYRERLVNHQSCINHYKQYIYILSNSCYTYINHNTIYQSEITSLWLKLQHILSISLPILYSKEELNQIYLNILMNPIQYNHVIPGILDQLDCYIDINNNINLFTNLLQYIERNYMTISILKHELVITKSLYKYVKYLYIQLTNNQDFIFITNKLFDLIFIDLNNQLGNKLSFDSFINQSITSYIMSLLATTLESNSLSIEKDKYIPNIKCYSELLVTYIRLFNFVIENKINDDLKSWIDKYIFQFIRKCYSLFINISRIYNQQNLTITLLYLTTTNISDINYDSILLLDESIISLFPRTDGTYNSKLRIAIYMLFLKSFLFKERNIDTSTIRINIWLHSYIISELIYRYNFDLKDQCLNLTTNLYDYGLLFDKSIDSAILSITQYQCFERCIVNHELLPLEIFSKLNNFIDGLIKPLELTIQSYTSVSTTYITRFDFNTKPNFHGTIYHGSMYFNTACNIILYVQSNNRMIELSTIRSNIITYYESMINLLLFDVRYVNKFVDVISNIKSFDYLSKESFSNNHVINYTIDKLLGLNTTKYLNVINSQIIRYNSKSINNYINQLTGLLENSNRYMENCDNISNLLDSLMILSTNTSINCLAIDNLEIFLKLIIPLYTTNYFSIDPLDILVKISNSLLAHLTIHLSDYNISSEFVLILYQLLYQLVRTSESAMNNYLSILSNITKDNGTILLTSHTDINTTSPIQLTNLFTSTGSYTLGFWCNVKSIDLSIDRKIHIFTRFNESIDFNTISLLNHEFPCVCDPSIFLSIENQAIYLSIYITFPNKRIHVKSNSIKINSWNNYIIKVIVDKTINQVDSIKCLLCVNNILEQSIEVDLDEAYRSMAYQSGIIGFIPEQISAIKYELNTQTSIYLSTVYWIPSNKQLSSELDNPLVNVPLHYIVYYLQLLHKSIYQLLSSLLSIHLSNGLFSSIDIGDLVIRLFSIGSIDIQKMTIQIFRCYLYNISITNISTDVTMKLIQSLVVYVNIYLTVTDINLSDELSNDQKLISNINLWKFRCILNNYLSNYWLDINIDILYICCTIILSDSYIYNILQSNYYFMIENYENYIDLYHTLFYMSYGGLSISVSSTLSTDLTIYQSNCQIITNQSDDITLFNESIGKIVSYKYIASYPSNGYIRYINLTNCTIWLTNVYSLVYSNNDILIPASRDNQIITTSSIIYNKDSYKIIKPSFIPTKHSSGDFNNDISSNPMIIHGQDLIQIFLSIVMISNKIKSDNIINPIVNYSKMINLINILKFIYIQINLFDYQLIIQNIISLVSISLLDPIEIISKIFYKKYIKSNQLEILKSLLVNNNVYILDKIIIQLQHKIFSYRKSIYLNTIKQRTIDSSIHCIAGEVSISNNKIKAFAHFPTIRLLDVSIQRFTGRWYYECTLLTDGLIQIGWASSQFRCDPLCGQGVGDNYHSWAFDGLRSKKWNVSCESYGKRWKVGDVVGTLLDMDLLEIRFYVNGEDLGPAYDKCSQYDMYPAISLNVRQTIRVNFGSYRFMYPPDEIDKKPFQPVCQAIGLKNFSLRKKSKKIDDNSNSNNNDLDINSSVLDNSSSSISVNWNNNAITTNRLDERDRDDSDGLDVAESEEDDNENDNNNDNDDNDDNDNDDDNDNEDRNDQDDEEINYRSSKDNTDRSNHDNSPDYVEMNRQQLIENLIAMGFPIDWALRAVENCHDNISESLAIAWIIEQMENKNNDSYSNRGDMSSRLDNNLNSTRNHHNDDDEFDDIDDIGLEYLLHRDHVLSNHISNHISSHITSSAVNNPSSNTNSNNVSSNSNSSVTMNSPGSVIREEVSAMRRRVNGLLDNLTSNQNNSTNFINNNDINILNTVLSYHSIQFPIDTSNQSSNESDILKQLLELADVDLNMIVSCCQFTCCIYYSRIIICQLLKQLTSSNPMHELFISYVSPALLYDIIKVTYKQYIYLSISQSNGLNDYLNMSTVSQSFINELTNKTTELEKYLHKSYYNSYCLSNHLVNQLIVQTMTSFPKVLSIYSSSEIIDDIYSKSLNYIELVGMLNETIDCDWLAISNDINNDVVIGSNTKYYKSLVNLSYQTTKSIYINNFAKALNNNSDDYTSYYNIKFLQQLVKINQLTNNITIQFICYDLTNHFIYWILQHFENQRLNQQNNDAINELFTDYYLIIDNLKHQVYTFNNKYVVECLYNKQIHSKFCQVLNNYFILKDLLKDKLVTNEFKYIHEYIIQDWIEKYDVHNQHNQILSDNTISLPISNSIKYLNENQSSNSINKSTNNAIISNPIVNSYIKVIQISSNSVTILWSMNISNDLNKAMENDICLFVKNCSNVSNDNEEAIPVAIDLDISGQYKINDLQPDTLYLVYLSIEQSPSKDDQSITLSFLSNPIDPVSIFVSTESEPIFNFESNHVSPQLVIGSNFLSIRNTSNKKWSTARINVPMLSGVHRWEVHIDRCISKNIFIGICSAEAKLDNYCGCDVNGWAFLANKAIWHNKTKIRTYGELFKTNDNIGIELDLDKRTLSFILNGYDLGVAVLFEDDMSDRPYYPAFSLYNEDDQISIVPSRLPIHSSLSRTSLIDRIVNRQEILVQLFNFFDHSINNVNSHLTKYPSNNTKSLLNELRRRWDLWLTNITMKSYLINGDIYIIISNIVSCMDISSDRLVPHDIVYIDGIGKAKVLGISRHKLWFQKDGLIDISNDRFLFGYTKENLMQLINKGSLKLLYREAVNNKLDKSINLKKYDITNGIVSCNIPNFTNYNSIFLSTIIEQSSNWTIEYDRLLVQFIDIIIISNNLCDPSDISVNLIINKREIIQSNDSNSFIIQLKDLFFRFSDADIILRCVLLIHMNDLLIPLLSLIVPQNIITYYNPYSLIDLIVNYKDLIFEKVRNDYLINTSSLLYKCKFNHATSSNVSLIKGHSFVITNRSVDSKSSNDLNKDKDNNNDSYTLLLNQSLDLFNELASKQVDRSTTVFNIQLTNLLLYIQASFIGQLTSYINKQPEFNGYLLRCSNSYITSNSNSLPVERLIPFRLRSLKQTNRNQFEESRLFRLLEIARNNPGNISEYSIFRTFIYEAIEQIQDLITRLIDERDSRIDKESKDELIGEVSLIRQYMHSIGIVIGIALRMDIPFTMNLSDDLLDILTTSNPTNSSENCILTNYIMNMKYGIISIYSEQSLALLSSSYLKYRMNGWTYSYGNISVLKLRKCCIYCTGTTDSDIYIDYFWTALSELSSIYIITLLKSIWRKHSIINEYLYLPNEQLPYDIRLSIDPYDKNQSNFVINEDNNELVIPRYNYQMMCQQLLIFLTSLTYNL